MSEHNGSLRSNSWSSFLFGLWFLVGLVNGSTRWMGLHPTQIFLCSQSHCRLTQLWVESRGAWGRRKMINLLSWKCHWCWRMGNGGRTRWQAWNHDRNEVLRFTLCPNPVFNEMWFLTIDPFVKMSICIAKLSERQHCWCVIEVHFTISACDCRRTAQFRQNIHFGRIQVLFADHVHRRSGVDNKFLFLKFMIWCRQGPIFRKWEECCLIFLLYF